MPLSINNIHHIFTSLKNSPHSTPPQHSQLLDSAKKSAIYFIEIKDNNLSDIENITNAINKLKASDCNPENIDEFSESLPFFYIEKAKLKLEFNTNADGKVCLSLRVLYPDHSDNIELKVFNEKLTALEHLSLSQEKLDLFNAIRIKSDNFNFTQRSQNGISNYLDCALDKFQAINAQTQELKQRKPLFINICGSGDGLLDAEKHVFYHQKKQLQGNHCKVLEGPSSVMGMGFNKNSDASRR